MHWIGIRITPLYMKMKNVPPAAYCPKKQDKLGLTDPKSVDSGDDLMSNPKMMRR